MRVAYHPDYRVDLPPTHPYPMGKYPLLHARLLAAGWIEPGAILEPEEAPLVMLERVHERSYLEQLADGALTPAQVRRLGVPLTPRLWRRSRLAVHGTWLAALAALEDGLAGNLAGGTHHAFAGHGEGFCVLNDVAVAVRSLAAERGVRRALVVDLDVHQGNGTAAILGADPDVYTLSLHGARNYPHRKERSSRDVELDDGTGDEAYLAALAPALEEALATARPEITFYVAGVDVLAGDRYGRLALSEAGLRRRERHVVGAVRDAGCPLAIVLGGGYAATTLRTAELHALVFEAAIERWREERTP
ncbi:MAG: histone deacetylase [Proteobacteria bacterium]|nr:histone deacetylase [Pseudomonadota bacterium]